VNPAAELREMADHFEAVVKWYEDDLYYSPSVGSPPTLSERDYVRYAKLLRQIVNGL
jgi:hypothetical protein